MQSSANVTKGTTDWHNIDWYKTNRVIRNLRRRIFKATQENNWRKVRNLQKLMLQSYSNVLLSVRKATQDNKGSKTAGVDKILVKTPQQRLAMANSLTSDRSWSPKPASRVYIPKKNGKLRPLGIPTIKDTEILHLVCNRSVIFG